MRSLSIAAIIVAASVSFAKPLPDLNGIPFDRFNSWPTLNGRSPAGATISPDGKHVIFAWNTTGARMRDLWHMDVATGQKRVLLEAAKIPRPLNQDDARTDEQKREQEQYDGGFGGGALWSPDSKEFLVSYRGRTWRYDLAAQKAEPLFDGNFEASNLEYTHDGRYLLFIHESNVWRKERSTKQLKQLTFVTRGNTAVGDFEVSPNGKHVAINWSSFGNFGSHIMMDFTTERSQVRNISRMWNGNVNALDEQYGIVPIDGGMIRFVTGIPRAHWGLGSRGAGWQWAPDSSGFLVGWKTEDHKEWTLSYISAESGREFPIHKEKAPKNYINNWRPFYWTEDSQHIFVGTDIDPTNGQFTNRHVLKVSKNGREKTPYFKKDYDVANLQKAGKTDNLILITQSRNPLLGEITLMRTNGTTEVFTPVENGWNSPVEFENAGEVLVDEAGRNILTTAQSPTINPELYRVTPKIERLTTSQLPDFAKIPWSQPQMISFPGPEGATVHAQMILPPNYVKGTRIPFVIGNMYANSGKLDWDGYTHNYMAQALGIGVLKIDFRASWGQGGEFNSGYYQKMGLIDSEEAVAAKKWLVDNGYAKADRMGVWGWSYGGFLTLMILGTQPGQFHAGVAVASVTEWKNYNHWYTRQRLGLADRDKAIFDKTSPITYADKMQGHLLLVHGMLDDNVLFQDSARFAMKMIDANKDFQQMFYPRDDHSIGRDETRIHVQRQIVQYLYDKLSE